MVLQNLLVIKHVVDAINWVTHFNCLSGGYRNISCISFFHHPECSPHHTGNLYRAVYSSFSTTFTLITLTHCSTDPLTDSKNDTMSIVT